VIRFNKGFTIVEQSWNLIILFPLLDIVLMHYAKLTAIWLRNV